MLWRHDCDYSLNRSLRLAQLESQESVNSTYFLNPHCEFYNLLEKRQTEIVEKILLLGHDIGLHFDAAYYDIESEDQLDALVKREAGWLKNWFDVEPVAFSFHNPTQFLLSCERATYGGLINCYSRTLKTAIPYCSDSNGYWRFRRLREVLESAQDPCLQVLTHPGWWQETPLHPRERIFRSVYGRAHSVMNHYDHGLQTHERKNLAGPAGSLQFLKKISIVQYQLCDFLWNSGHLNELLLELYRLHIRQLKSFFRAAAVNYWHVRPSDVDEFLQQIELERCISQLTPAVCDVAWDVITSTSDIEYQRWSQICRTLFRQGHDVSSDIAEEGCLYFCKILASAAVWGGAEDAIFNEGISVIESVEMPLNTKTRRQTSPLLGSQKWRALKQKFATDP